MAELAKSQAPGKHVAAPFLLTPKVGRTIESAGRLNLTVVHIFIHWPTWPPAMNQTPYQVLIGNVDPTLNPVFLFALKAALKGDFDLQVTTLDHIGILAKASAGRKFDLCILVLTSIETPEPDSIQERIDQVFDFIACLKAKHRTPVIALSHCAVEQLPDRVKRAGADFYFGLPVDPEKLKRTIQRCLKMTGKAPGEFSRKIPPLPHSVQHYVNAAEGWLELGNQVEANGELDQVPTELRVHPDVLELRWKIYAAAKKWEACVEIGHALVKMAPARPDSWIHRSYALHILKRTEEASDLLLAAADLFPGHWLIMYNLACYACCLDNQEEAWDWLEDAFELGDAKQVKLMALEDPELDKLWAEIREV